MYSGGLAQKQQPGKEESLFYWLGFWSPVETGSVEW